MKFWRCVECSEECDEPNIRLETFTSEAWGQVTRHTEEFYVCPHCGSESIDEVEEEDECPDCEGRGCVECGANVGAE